MTQQQLEPPRPVAPTPRPGVLSSAAPIAWGLLAAALLGLVVLGLRASKLRGELTNGQQELAIASAKLTDLTKERDTARGRIKKLEQDAQKLSGELRETAAQKEAAQTELEHAKQELSTKLQAEIKSGEVVIQQRGQDLVVDVSDKILFDTGKSEINDRGKQVLRQVSSTLARTHRVFQIGGHTDAMRVVSPEVRERFPTNWELSTARATTVVRFLQEQCGVPGNRLVAAGYAQYRPAASNTTEDGRRRNRRIEIALVKELPAQ